jgi:cell wall-associated NlpC family hydrolase
MRRWAALPLLMVLPSAVSAQSERSIAPFVSVNGALADSPTLLGLSTASFLGPLGFRMSAGAAAGGDRIAVPGLADHWAADVDVSLAPMRFLRWRGGSGLEPVLLFGFGLGGGHSPDGRYFVPNSTYGAGAWYTLTRWLRMEGELRRRSALGDVEALPRGAGDGWELRIGAALVMSRAGTPRPAFARAGRSEAGAPVLDAPDIAPDAAIALLAASVLDTAAGYLGTPYRFGGTDPATGLDCSAFVQQIFAAHGMPLPRTSRQQAQVGAAVDPGRGLQPGDLLFFASNGSRIDHVAVYAGGNTIIHATGSGRGVRYDDLATTRGRWFLDNLVAARRVLGTDLAAAAFIPAPADTELDPPDRAPPVR